MAKAADSVLPCIRQSIASSSKVVILPLYSAVTRPYLECWVQFWVPQYEKVMHLLE